MIRPFATAAALAWLACTPVYAQTPPSPPNYAYAHAAAATIALDFASTWGGVTVGCLSGERNARYWTAGDYARPDYRQMAVEGAAIAALGYAIERATAHRTGKVATALRRFGRGVMIGTAVRRGYAAYGNMQRCTMRTIAPAPVSAPAPLDITWPQPIR